MAGFDAHLPAEQINIDYNARATVTEAQFDVEIGRYQALTTKARQECDAQCGLAYDDHSTETLDFYPATLDTPAPVVIFIHGGYWRALGREHSGFMAPMLASHGIATIVPDYTLAPAVTLSEITRQMRACLAHVWHNHTRYGIDRNRITLVGSSAGGHLVGALLSGGWQDGFGLPATPVASAMPISGLFDLAPIARSFAQDWLNLTPADVASLSPLQNLPPKGGCPIVNAYAAGEPAGFARQSQAYHAAWTAAGFTSQLLEIPDRNHFDVVLELCNPDSDLSAALLRLVRRGETP